MDVTSNRAKSVFLDAVENCPPERWDDFLVGACEGDADLRRRVRVLLDAHQGADSLLDQPGPAATATAACPLTEGPGTMIGPYKLLEPIGEGGMGVVFMSEQAHPVRRRVALKVIKPGMDTRQVVARFEAERQALALMDHPNIAKVLDVGATEAGRPYFVMELVRGVPITRYCDSEKLPLKDRLDLFVLVCRAVQHAHQKGIIHRDIKPSNVLITLHDGVPVPKVIDFGVAKATGGRLTEKTLFTAFAQLVGTPLYMSPEQAELSGLDIDTRSDIYSLGVLLYELLTGTTPFDAEMLRRAAFDEMRRMIREDQPPTPSTRLVSLGETSSTVSANRGSDPRRLGQLMRGELDWIVMKALEKDRTRRYETANDFAADVMRHLADRPVEACPPSTRYRLGKFARRNRTGLITSGIVSISLLAGTIVSTWQAVVAVRARRESSAALATARRAVDEMYTQFAEKWIAQQPRLTALQREFLEKALAFYEQFSAVSADGPQSRFNSAVARYKVGSIQRSLGMLAESAVALRQSVEQLEELVARFPERAEYASSLAFACIDLGGLEFELGRRREAGSTLKRSVAIMDGVVSRDRGNREHRSLLAYGLLSLGQYYSFSRRLDEAEPLLRRSRDLFAGVASQGRVKPVFRKCLPLCENQLGNVCRAKGRFAEAEAAQVRAMKRAESLLADDPADPYVRDTLATSHGDLATVLHAVGRSQEALAHDHQSVDILEALANDFPDFVNYRIELATCMHNTCVSLLGTGRYDEAGQLGRRGLALAERLALDYPADPLCRDRLRQFLYILADFHSSPPTGDPHHDPSRALELARRAFDLKPDDDMARQSLGWSLYRTGDWEGCIKALNKLEDVNGSGFFLPMAYWRLGEEQKAREAFDRADKRLVRYESHWNPTIYPSPTMLRLVRAEAASLLGLGPDPTRGVSPSR